MKTDFVAFAPLRLPEEAVEVWGEVAVEAEEEEVVVEVEEVEVVVVDRGAMATTSPKALLRPGRGPGPARPPRATPT